MKRIPWLLILLSIAIIPFTACKSKKGGSGEAYTLKMRLAKGDQFNHDLDMNVKSEFAAMGQAITMNMDLKGGTKYEVTGVTDDLKDLTLTYTKMNVSADMKGGGQSRSFSSDKVNKGIVGKSVVLKINNKNEITDVVGFEDAMWGDSTDMQTREQMKKMFSKEQINGMLGLMFNLYPDHPVRVGDSWEKEYDASVSGFKMKMQATYTLESVKNGIANVKLDGKYKGKGTLEMGVMNMEMQMDGGQKGNIAVGLDNGYVKDSDVKMDIDATMEIQGQKVSGTIKGYYLVKGN